MSIILARVRSILRTMYCGFKTKSHVLWIQDQCHVKCRVDTMDSRSSAIDCGLPCLFCGQKLLFTPNLCLNNPVFYQGVGLPT